MSERRDDMFRVKPRPPTKRRRIERTAISVACKDGGEQARRSCRPQVSRPSWSRRQARSWLGGGAAHGHESGPACTPRCHQDSARRFQAGRTSVGGHAPALHRPRWRGPGRAAGAGLQRAKPMRRTSMHSRSAAAAIGTSSASLWRPKMRSSSRTCATSRATLMGRMERDLGTRLEWVAVDHWDTDNPHTHVVLRGKDQAGENLVIGREYISRGMRIRAGELATSLARSADRSRDPGEPAARGRPGPLHRAGSQASAAHRRRLASSTCACPTRWAACANGRF